MELWQDWCLFNARVVWWGQITEENDEILEALMLLLFFFAKIEVIFDWLAKNSSRIGDRVIKAVRPGVPKNSPCIEPKPETIFAIPGRKNAAKLAKVEWSPKEYYIFGQLHRITEIQARKIHCTFLKASC